MKFAAMKLAAPGFTAMTFPHTPDPIAEGCTWPSAS